MNKPTDRQILTRALELLAEGLLVSLLPARLMLEFHLSQERAARLASEAIRQRRQEGQDITR